MDTKLWWIVKLTWTSKTQIKLASIIILDLEVLRPSLSTIKLQSNDPITQQVHRFYHQIGSIISIETREFAESLNENLQVLGQASLFRFLSALCPFLFLFFLFLFSHVLSLSRPLCVFFFCFRSSSLCFLFAFSFSLFFSGFSSSVSFVFFASFLSFFFPVLAPVFVRPCLLWFSIRLCSLLLCLLFFFFFDSSVRSFCLLVLCVCLSPLFFCFSSPLFFRSSHSRGLSLAFYKARECHAIVRLTIGLAGPLQW